MDKHFNEQATQSLPRPLPEPVHRGLAAAEIFVDLFTIGVVIAAIVAGISWLFS